MSLKLDLVLHHQDIHIATITRALSMLSSTAEKATQCVRSFCLVKSSYKNNIIDVVHQWHASHDKSFQAFPQTFHTASDKSWAWRPGNDATNSGHSQQFYPPSFIPVLTDAEVLVTENVLSYQFLHTIMLQHL